MLSNDITIETMVVPGDEDNAVGGIYDGAWVWRYDLAAAADRMHLFIYGEVPETTASSKKKQESQTTTKSSKSSSSATKSSGSSNGGSKSKSSATTSAKHSGGNNKSETTTKPPRQPKTAKLPKSTLRLNPRQRHRPTKLSRQRDKFKQYIF